MSRNSDHSFDAPNQEETVVYVLGGKVLPERAQVNLPKPVAVDISTGKIIPEGSVVYVTVICSQISMVVHSRGTIADLQSLAHECEGMCRMIVDCWGFLLTCGYDIEITQVSSTGGLHVVYGVQPADLRPIPFSDESIPDIFERLITIPNAYQLQYRRALADYREAIRSFEDTAFFCYRAVEDLRQVFVIEGRYNESQTWERLWTALPVAEDIRAFVQNKIRPLATGNRHGGGTSMTREQRLEMLNITSRVIAAFVDWARQQ